MAQGRKDAARDTAAKVRLLRWSAGGRPPQARLLTGSPAAASRLLMLRLISGPAGLFCSARLGSSLLRTHPAGTCGAELWAKRARGAHQCRAKRALRGRSGGRTGWCSSTGCTGGAQGEQQGQTASSGGRRTRWGGQLLTHGCRADACSRKKRLLWPPVPVAVASRRSPVQAAQARAHASCPAADGHSGARPLAVRPCEGAAGAAAAGEDPSTALLPWLIPCWRHSALHGVMHCCSCYRASPSKPHAALCFCLLLLAAGRGAAGIDHHV